MKIKKKNKTMKTNVKKYEKINEKNKKKVPRNGYFTLLFESVSTKAADPTSGTFIFLWLTFFRNTTPSTYVHSLIDPPISDINEIE